MSNEKKKLKYGMQVDILLWKDKRQSCTYSEMAKVKKAIKHMIGLETNILKMICVNILMRFPIS